MNQDVFKAKKQKFLPTKESTDFHILPYGIGIASHILLTTHNINCSSGYTEYIIETIDIDM